MIHYSYFFIFHYSGTQPYGHLGKYSHVIITATFFQSGKKAVHFPIKNPLLMWSPINTVNGHILKSQTVESLKISPH